MDEKNFFDKDEYSFDDILSLINNDAEESINLEFKAAGALEKSDGKKKEICKDVSAFANSDGGIIVYGIVEENHCAESVSFIDGDVYSKEWLEQVVNAGIQRRIEGLKIYPIRKDGDVKQTVYIVKIPYSYGTPHISIDKKYYRRFNFQSVPMEEYEVRQLYERKRQSKLCIAGYSVEYVKNDDYSMYKFKLKIDIANQGLTVENTYKLNFYINVKNISDSCSISFTWDKHIDHNDYQILKLDGKVKISCQGKFSVFPDETVNAMNVSLLLPKGKFAELKEKAIFEIKLFYTNGVHDVKMDANIFNIK